MTTGRRRRKKCDELRPICINCARNGFSCSWPKTASAVQTTSHQLLQASSSRSPSSKTLLYFVGDASSNSSPNVQTGQLAIASSLPNPLSTNLFDSEMQSSMFQYCTHLLLPPQAHNQPGSFYEGQSYTVSMGIHFTPLLDAMLACAATTLSNEAEWFQDFAVNRYISAVQGVRAGLVDGSLTGTEDHLLAAVMWLCVFEV